MNLNARKLSARKAGFARRKAAFDRAGPGRSAFLSEFLAGYRGVDIAGYMPIRSEINPIVAMEEAAAYGRVAVPVIIGAGQALRFSRWEPECALRDGPFGAQVPAVDNFFDPEIVIVPLVAFDGKGGRLGYGGGYYDRTLEGLRATRAILAVGFAFSAQEAEELPLEATDQPLDLIITEAGVRSFS